MKFLVLGSFNSANAFKFIKVYAKHLAFPIHQFLYSKRINTNQTRPAETFNIWKIHQLLFFFIFPSIENILSSKYYCLFSIKIQLVGSTLSRKFSFYYLFSVLKSNEWIQVNKCKRRFSISSQNRRFKQYNCLAKKMCAISWVYKDLLRLRKPVIFWHDEKKAETMMPNRDFDARLKILCIIIQMQIRRHHTSKKSPNSLSSTDWEEKNTYTNSNHLNSTTQVCLCAIVKCASNGSLSTTTMLTLGLRSAYRKQTKKFIF